MKSSLIVQQYVLVNALRLKLSLGIDKCRRQCLRDECGLNHDRLFVLLMTLN